MSGMRKIAAVAVALALCGASAIAQNTWTNFINASQNDVWGVPTNWTNELSANGIPGFDVNTGTGNSNDDAVVYFGYPSGGTPQLNLLASNYVLRTLYLAETTNANQNSDGNIISTLGPSSLTLEEVNYFQGGRQLDFFTNVALIDRDDGKAFVVNHASTLDFGGGLRGTEGINFVGNQTLYIRGYDMGYGVDPTNGITISGASGGGKRLAFNGTLVSNITHDVPNLTYQNAGGSALTFLNLSPSNTAIVNIQNLTLETNTTQFSIGGESAADGTPIVTVNVNDDIDFATNSTAHSDRTVDSASVHGGIVNLNGNIIVNQDFETNRTLIFSGNGVFNLNGNVLQTNGTARTRPTRIDGDRSLVVAIDDPGRLGEGLVQLNNGSVLRMNYDVYSSLTNGGSGYAGSNLVYNENRNIFLDFGVAQGGFYDPRDNTGVSGLVVRAFNGIAGNLTGASITNASGYFANNTISFETNAIVAENTINQPAFADYGNTLWMGITNAAGSYTDVGNTATVFRGVAISAITPQGEGDIFSLGTDVNIDTALSGYRGDLTAAAGMDLRVLVPGNAFVMPVSGTNTAHRATFNSDTGRVFFEGPGVLFLENRNSWQVYDGTASNLFRLGLDGVNTPDNPLAINTQNAEILRLTGNNSVATNTTLTVADGQVRFFGGAAQLGNAANNLNTTLIVSNGASIFADNNNASAAFLNIDRGKIIFAGDGAVYTGGGNDGFNAAATPANNMVFSPQSLLIINDTGDNRFRDLNSAGYTHFLSNMNIVIADDIMQTAQVASATAFALGDGKRLINPANVNGNLNRIIRVAAGVTNDVAITAVRNASEVRISATGGRTFNIAADVATTNAALTILNNFTNRFITVRDNGSERTNATQNGTVNLNGLDNRFQDLRLEGGVAQIFGTNTVANNVESTGMRGAPGALRLFADLNTVSNALSTEGGDLWFGNNASDVTRIFGDVVMRESTNDSASVILGSGVVQVAGNIYTDFTSNTNRAPGYGIRIGSAMNIYSDTGIINGTVWIGPTNPGVAGSALLRVNDQDTDVTIIGGDLVLNQGAAYTTGSQLNRGDVVVSNNIVVNAFGIDRRATTNDLVFAPSGNANLLLINARRDFVTNDGIGLLDRLEQGTLALGSEGIIVRPYGEVLVDVNRTNDYTQVIGQKITIDNGGARYKEDQSMLWMRAQTNEFVGGAGTGIPVIQLTNIWMNDNAHLRLNEENTAVQVGLVLAGTNTYLSESTSGSSSASNEDFDLLDVVSSVGGQSRTLWIGATDGVAEASFETALLGTASSDVTLNVVNGALTVTNGGGNFLNLARAAGVNSQTNALIRLVGTALDNLSNISGRVEVGDFGRVILMQPRTNATAVIGSEIRIANTGFNFVQGGTGSAIRVENSGGSTGTTIYELTNVVLASGSVLRVDEGGNNVARVGLSIEGTAGGGSATLSDAVGDFAEPFEMLDVRSSTASQSRTLQIGASGAQETPLVTSLLGTSSVDVTFDVFNGRLTVASGADVQGSVKVRDGSTFQTLNTVEELLNLSGDGVVIGNVLVSNTLAPGLSPGTLTVTGNMQFVATSVLDFELSATSTNSGGGINDLLQLVGPSGDLTLDGTLLWTNVASVVGQGWTNGDYWTLITYAGNLSDNGLELGSLPSLDPGLAWLLDTSVGGEVRLSIVIPEPSTWALLACGFGLMGWLSRRRRS